MHITSTARFGVSLRAHKIGLLLCALACCSFSSLTYARHEVTYSVTFIATPPPDEPNSIAQSFVTDLNNSGEVAGALVGADGLQHAFVWRDGEFRDLNVLLASDVLDATPSAINDRSDVVGGYEDFQSRPHSFFLTRRNRFIPLTGASGDFISPTDVNNRREVLLETFTPGLGSQRFIWRRGQLTRLEDLPGSEDVTALAINNHGIALGYVRGAQFSFTPVLWQDGTVMPVPTPAGSDGALAVALNDRNAVAAWAVFRDEFPGRQQAYIWRDGEITLLLPASPELNRTVPSDINDHGVVVGVSLNLAGVSKPTIWRGVRGQDANDLIEPDDPLAPFVRLTGVSLINDRGQIVAGGVDSRSADGLGSWYLLTPKVRRHPSR